METSSLACIVQRGISSCYGLVSESVNDSGIRCPIASYYLEQGREVSSTIRSLPSANSSSDDVLLNNPSFQSVWSVLLHEEAVTMRRLKTLSRLEAIASENKEYVAEMRRRFSRSNIVGVDKEMDVDEDEEYSGYEGDYDYEYDYDEYSSDSYAMYPQTEVVLQQEVNNEEEGNGEEYEGEEYSDEEYEEEEYEGEYSEEEHEDEYEDGYSEEYEGEYSDYSEEYSNEEYSEEAINLNEENNPAYPEDYFEDEYEGEYSDYDSNSNSEEWREIPDPPKPQQESVVSSN